MGRDEGDKETKRRRHRHGRSSKRSRDASPSPSTASSDSDSASPSSDSSPSRSRSRSSSKRRKSSSSSHRHRRSHKSSGQSRSSRDEDRRRRRRRRDADGSFSSGSEETDREDEAREIVRDILKEFPAVAGELRQLLQMIDSGEGIDISGISDKPLVKRLKKLFRSLRLKESASGAYLLPQKNVPTLDIVGEVLLASLKLADNKRENSISPTGEELPSSNFDAQNKIDITSEASKVVDVEEEPPKRSGRDLVEEFITANMWPLSKKCKIPGFIEKRIPLRPKNKMSFPEVPVDKRGFGDDGFLDFLTAAGESVVGPYTREEDKHTRERTSHSGRLNRVLSLASIAYPDRVAPGPRAKRNRAPGNTGSEAVGTRKSQKGKGKAPAPVPVQAKSKAPKRKREEAAATEASKRAAITTPCRDSLGSSTPGFQAVGQGLEACCHHYALP
ncbi:hypothetical protein PR202_gb29538 [Eleusine coracana subsp. coracana]|uniref:Uncharacterized protein n=1 Tax=Eleusine coracana subsp. coracana TaxID=191504 RepID=A0AAV5FXA8_ELECO|nr:hypothetical protein PR202_gb29538 [Eleusine coracana subsp. coracana]